MDIDSRWRRHLRSVEVLLEMEGEAKRKGDVFGGLPVFTHSAMIRHREPEWDVQVSLGELCEAIEEGTYYILSAFESILPLLERAGSRPDYEYQSDVLSQLREMSRHLESIDQDISHIRYRS